MRRQNHEDASLLVSIAGEGMFWLFSCSVITKAVTTERNIGVMRPTVCNFIHK